MGELLDALEGRGLRWGVVTNKPAGLTLPLLEGLGLRARAATVVSGDTLPQRKPDPAPMLLACREAGCTPAACVYVGDAERDIQAGRAAGMATLVALFGYIGADDRPLDWQADGAIAHPLEVVGWLDAADARRANA
jgi:phosphoglycolate phosphatase